MSANTSKNYEVILNGPALGLAEGDNIKTVSAVRFDYDQATARVVFFDSDGNTVAMFQNVFSVMEASK